MVIVCLIGLPLAGYSADWNKSELNNDDLNKIANAIYQIEGGKNTKYPYGIKSVKTAHPRQVCINTIRNNFGRWHESKSKLDFLTFLANVYCPRSVDLQGNSNWIKNIHKILK